MGVLRILVFCALVFIIRCENTSNLQTKSSATTDIRYKKETETDVHLRESKVKVPYLLKPAKPKILATNYLNPINTSTYTLNALPQRNLTPVVTKPKVLSTTKDNEKNPKNDHIDNNLNNDALVKPSEKTKAINLATDKNNENEEVQEKTPQENPELNTTDETVKYYDEDKNPVIADETINQITTSSVNKMAELNKDGVKSNTNKDIDIDQKLTKNLDGQALDPIENFSSKHFLLKPTEIPDIPLQTSRISDKDIVDEKTPKLVYPTIHSDKGKMPITIAPKINPFQVSVSSKPIMKAANESAAIITQKNDGNQIKMTIEKPEFEPEEIVIQNNNFEELVQTATPQYMIPKRISADLRPAPNSNNFNTIPYYYEQVDIPHESKSYSYEVKKYPNQYVVNVYDDIESGRRNIVQSQEWMNNQDKAKEYNSPWSQHYSNFNQFEEEDIKQKSSVGYNQLQGYPKIIRRTWNNNQIFIRPKYRCVCQKLYNILGSYLANSNRKGVPIYTSNFIGYGAYGNQNTSPYMNPFQYRRYGY